MISEGCYYVLANNVFHLIDSSTFPTPNLYYRAERFDGVLQTWVMKPFGRARAEAPWMHATRQGVPFEANEELAATEEELVPSFEFKVGDRVRVKVIIEESSGTWREEPAAVICRGNSNGKVNVRFDSDNKTEWVEGSRVRPTAQESKRKGTSAADYAHVLFGTLVTATADITSSIKTGAKGIVARGANDEGEGTPVFLNPWGALYTFVRFIEGDATRAAAGDVIRVAVAHLAFERESWGVGGAAVTADNGLQGGPGGASAAGPSALGAAWSKPLVLTIGTIRQLTAQRLFVTDPRILELVSKRMESPERRQATLDRAWLMGLPPATIPPLEQGEAAMETERRMFEKAVKAKGLECVVRVECEERALAMFPLEVP